MDGHAAGLRFARQQTFDGVFALARHNEIGSGAQIFVGIVGRLRTTQDHLPSGGAGARGDIQHIAPGHQVAVDSDGRRRTGIQDVEQLLAGAKSGVINIDIESLAAQVGRQIENAQRRVGLHDLAFFRIFAQKIGVREQEPHDAAPGFAQVKALAGGG